jgi:hypothetical protein
MNLVERVKSILLTPKETWPAIEQEASSTGEIYSQYLIFLAAIPAVAGFIGMSLIGIGSFGISFKVPLMAGLANMVVGFVLSLVMVYVLSLIANALATTFGGEKNPLNALKLVAYSATAGMVGGIFTLLPSLSFLALLASLYSIYLIYTGIPVLMKAPQEKALGYTAVLIICGIVAGVVMGAVSTLVTGGGMGGGFPAMMQGSGGTESGDVSIKIPGAEITLDTAKMEAANRKMEEAQKSGDTEAASAAMGEMLGAAMGGKGGKPFAPETLKGFVPNALGEFARQSLDARSESAMGMTFTSVTAGYANNDRNLEIKLQDLGAVPALAMAMGSWAQSTIDREDQTEVERVYKRDGATVKERYSKDGSSAEMSMMLGNGVMLEVEGSNVDFKTVSKVVAGLDVKGLAGLQRQQ